MIEVILLWSTTLCSLTSLVIVLILLQRSRTTKTDKSTELEQLIPEIQQQFRVSRQESADDSRRLREELFNTQKLSNESLEAGQTKLSNRLEGRQEGLRVTLESGLDKVRISTEQKLQSIQTDNQKKLDQMRETVEEKLQSTLEKRLGESFKLVSERLEAVQRGLGDMQNLAHGVGDLKRMLTNVKARGTWGEFQLEDILAQVLTPDQYAKNVQPKPRSKEIVEFAIRLPGQGDEEQIWLPIDSKFPQEDYQRLVDAADSADSEAVEKATNSLVRTIQSEARDIAKKYLSPPATTDFGIMFLSTEGLYAEVLRRPGLIEKIQNDHRVIISGPTTLAALLNSLRMGFRTMAIEKRSSEVWSILAAVKTEFKSSIIFLPQIPQLVWLTYVFLSRI